jgi:hypothetical protein
MIKLNMPREPHWIALAAGVRLQVRPATTALVMAARHAAAKVAGTDIAAAGERTATLITELAKLAVLAWEGVADDKGQPASVTLDGVAALMEHWLLADAFEREYLAGLYALESEKNA